MTQEIKPRIHVTLLGHKDHGKSTLIGRLLYETESVSEARVEGVRESCQSMNKPFEYAFLLDILQEERQDGMTIDIIHAKIYGNRYLYDCIDVPGHIELIKNMLTGASRAHAGILIVSAKEGIEEQTKNHLEIAQWLGLDHLLVAVNKMDARSYDQAVFEDMKRQIATLVGNNSFAEKIVYVPVSAYCGDNVKALSSKMPWYEGVSLYTWLEQLTIPKPFTDLPLRLPVQDVYSISGGEQIIAGRVESGTIRVGQSVICVPSGMTTTVKAIHGANENGNVGSAGENIGIVCEAINRPIKRGEVFCPVERVASSKKEVKVHAILLEPAPKRVIVECGTAQSECDREDLVTLEVGKVGAATLQLSHPIVAERSRTSLGRLVLKNQGKIIGCAVVMEATS